MKIERLTQDQLILSHVRWRAPMVCSGIALLGLAIAGLIWRSEHYGAAIWIGLLLAFLPGSTALLKAERVQLILDRTAQQAELRQRTFRGYHTHRFELANVQGTRVKRLYSYRNRHRSAKEDPNRILNLYVRDGMDEGRYPLCKAQIEATLALETSQVVNNWMKPVRAAQQRQAMLDSAPNDA